MGCYFEYHQEGHLVTIYGGRLNGILAWRIYPCKLKFAFCCHVCWKQHFRGEYFFTWVISLNSKALTNQSTDSIQQTRLSLNRLMNKWKFWRIVKYFIISVDIRTVNASFYLYTDPLRAESQIRRDIKFVISILFELSNTSWDASTFILFNQ